jgi:hypothetical protein
MIGSTAALGPEYILDLPLAWIFGILFQYFVIAPLRGQVGRLVQDASIIRNRAKIQATVDNARAMMSASPSLAALAKSYEITRKRAPRSVADLPKSTPQAEAFREAVEGAGVPLRGAYECVRVHAERRRGQRPRPWVLPRDRLPRHGAGALRVENPALL